MPNISEAVIKRAARSYLGDESNRPVEIVDGDQPPEWAGESFYYTTPSGKTRIAYPHAYKWPMVYHESTLRIKVGRQWAEERNLHIVNRQLRGRTFKIKGVNVEELYLREGVCYLCTYGNHDPYHHEAFNMPLPGDPKGAVIRALKAWKRQKQHRAALTTNRVFVSVEDSLKAGNCPSQTNAFAVNVWRQLGAAGPCAVASEVLLSMRDDSYTRRAVIAAQTRRRQLPKE